MKNSYSTATPKNGEIFKILLEHKNIKIEQIASSGKISDKVYKQKQDEWVLILKGSAKLDLDGKAVNMKDGDCLFIPSGQRHKVLETKSSTVWLAVHIF